MKVLSVFGTRPEAIKMAPVLNALEGVDNIHSLVCVTGQHREMLDQTLHAFGISTDFDLNVMSPGQDLFDITSSVLLGLRNVIDVCRPDIILVHGDTTTSFAASVSAYYSKVPVGHIEAGLRTFDINSPFPEEFNRRVTSLIAKFHFSPTESSKENLLSEGVDPKKIFVTGNTVIDSLFLTLENLEKDSVRKQNVIQALNEYLEFDWSSKRFILITGHRRENFGENFLSICRAIKSAAKKFPEVDFVYPVHLNPNVRVPVYEILGDLKNVHLIKPLEYEPFVYLLKASYFVLTDSGGIQEEAPSLGKPVIVMRDLTERPEAVSQGAVRLVGSDELKIVNVITELLTNDAAYREMALCTNPYGDGKAAQRIANILKETIS